MPAATPNTPAEDTLHTLRAQVRGSVRTSRHDRLLYATDASIYQVEPLAVIVPADLDDAVTAAKTALQQRLPLLPRGGGTSLAGQAVGRAVVLDLSSHCTKLLSVDPNSRRCCAEAGLTPADLNVALGPYKLIFAPDPSTVRQATLGGCIGNNAAGSHSILYGRTSDNIHDVEVLLANGTRTWLGPLAGPVPAPELVRLREQIAAITRQHAEHIRASFPKTLRRSAGYQLDLILAQLDDGVQPAQLDLTPLLCGSEGTLAITLRAELKLHPMPQHKGLAVVAFADLDEAIEQVVPLLETQPSAVELLDDLILELARGNTEQRSNVDLLPSIPGQSVRAVLYVEYFASDAEEIQAKLTDVQRRFSSERVSISTDPAAMQRAWALRVAGEPLLHGIPGSRTPVGFVEDNAVPPERLAEFVREFRAIVTEEGTTASFYAHASVGVLHVRPLLNLKAQDDRDRMQRIASRVADLAKSLGGVMSGEHGDGRARGPLLEAYFGPELMGAFRQVKRAFDPHNLLNPGNIVSPDAIESITTALRVLPEREPVSIPPTSTWFDYEDQTDFAHAVERCNGAGVCRKREGGVMCPSYRATLDERHSTRGRGNALRLAISGQSLPATQVSPWNDPDTLETLDLCLSCKACKTECPSNVDIARLKAEYQAKQHETLGSPPLRSVIFGHIAALQRLGGLTPRTANAIGNFPMTGWLVRAALGIHPNRSLPQLQRSLRKQWGPQPRPNTGTPRVALLADTFTTHNDPAIGLATRQLLESFGYHVELILADDLTRAKVSLGLLPEAVAAADRTLQRLQPWIEDDTVSAVVICEPSCWSAITDDWLQLQLQTPKPLRQQLAAKAMMPEQFLEAAWDTHPNHPAFKKPAGAVLLHAHCHQRALAGVGSSSSLLERLFPETEIRVLDATCCGMAGSFGFAKHRYDLSMRIGELGVLPAARELASQDVLLATGTSCRHQILDGASRLALHPAEFLAAQLMPQSDAL